MTGDAIDDPRATIKKAIESGDLKWLLEKAGELHGHYCPGLAYGVRLAYRAVTELGVHSTGMEEVVAIVEANNCFADGIQFVTGCTFGNNALIYRDFGKTALTLARRSGEGVRVFVDMSRESLEEREPEAMALFAKVVAQRQGSEEDGIRLKQLWRQASFNTLDIPDEELLKVQQVNVNLPAYAAIFPSVTCSVCGESVMEPRIRMKEGQPVCLPCSGQDYYQLDGNGMHLVCG
ncbi:MAG: FmdE family protein [Dehalococcoidia bacterium]